MTAINQTLSENNAHVQELKRLFLASNVDENQCLNSDGLFLLCEKLKLSAFASNITERVLCGSDVVDFYDFKERFVSYLPEIIDVSSGAVDPLLTLAQDTARSLGYGDGQKLTRYETRLLCENISELIQLSVVDINNLFERADVERTGRISLQQFLAQYRLQKRLSDEVHFISDSFISSLNLFEGLDPSNSGNIDSHDLLEYWNKAGLRIDEGILVLKESGQSVNGSLNAVYLSGFLERELSRSTSEAPVSVKAAIISLHCCIDNLRCMVREGESRAEHLHKQLQLGNQRRTLLIEELENNQISIEQGYEARLRETEERYRARCLQMEDKFRLDKREIQHEIEQLEEELSRVRQSETSIKNKVMLLERQNSRLIEENREKTEAVFQMEQLNRQFRAELCKAKHRPVEENTQLILYKQKLEIVVAHNKRLREKIQDLSASQKKSSKSSDGEPLTMKWSGAFRSQVMLIRKRRLAKGDTLSEMDSEPESIFVRHRRRRLLKRKERKQRHERIASRLFAQDSDETESSKAARNNGGGVRSELDRICNEHHQELVAVRQTAAKTLAEALNNQQKQLTLQLERERRHWEVRLVNEKNQMEKNFAEEKMKLMNRLQEEFDAELQRISSIVNRPENTNMTEHYKQQIKTLESTLENQKKNYEMRLAELRDRFKSTLHSHNNVYIPTENRSTNFISLLEKYRNSGSSPPGALEPYSSNHPSISVEKHSQPGNHLFHRMFANLVARCEKCDLTEMRLRELYRTVIGDHTLSESGIEDLSSSAGSLVDDKIVLKREVKKLKGRLDATKDKLTELQMLLSVPSQCKADVSGKDGKDSGLGRSFRVGDSALIDKLRSENVILESRLSEARHLIKTLVEQYNM